MEPRLRKTPGRTYYESTIEDFASNQNPNDIVDFLVESDEYTEPYQLHLQKGAWSNQIKILKKYLQDKKRNIYKIKKVILFLNMYVSA